MARKQRTGKKGTEARISKLVEAFAAILTIKNSNWFARFFLLAAARVDPGRNALQSAEQRCQ